MCWDAYSCHPLELLQIYAEGSTRVPESIWLSDEICNALWILCRFMVLASNDTAQRRRPLHCANKDLLSNLARPVPHGWPRPPAPPPMLSPFRQSDERTAKLRGDVIPSVWRFTLSQEVGAKGWESKTFNRRQHC